MALRKTCLGSLQRGVSKFEFLLLKTNMLIASCLVIIPSHSFFLLDHAVQWSSAIQGAGGGSMQALATIILSDLVPLSERAMYNAILGM